MFHGARVVCRGLKKRAMLMVDRRVFFSTLMYGTFAFNGVMSLEVGSHDHIDHMITVGRIFITKAIIRGLVQTI